MAGSQASLIDSNTISVIKIARLFLTQMFDQPITQDRYPNKYDDGDSGYLYNHIK